jgi:hypothetical protein
VRANSVSLLLSSVKRSHGGIVCHGDTKLWLMFLSSAPVKHLLLSHKRAHPNDKSRG